MYGNMSSGDRKGALNKTLKELVEGYNAKA